MTKKGIASLLLFSAALIWGASFVVMKNTLSVVSPNYILAFRFTTGAIGLSFILFRSRNRLGLKDILRGLLVGICLYAAFTLQTIGLQFISAGKNAMITSIYVVLVPFLMWMFKRGRPQLRSIISALMCFVGIALLSMADGGSEASSIESVKLFGLVLSGHTLELFGIALTLLSGVMFAMHIVVVSIFSEKMDVMPITFFQFFFAAIFAWIAAGLFETFPTAMTTETYLSLGYVCVFATLLALTFQNVGVQNAPATLASLILCTESLFACILSAIILREPLSFSMIMGCVLILSSMLISQLNIKRRKRNNAITDDIKTQN